jgi:polysaccharide export outer membrane protein
MKTSIFVTLLFVGGILGFPLAAQELADAEGDLRENYILRPNDVVKLSVYEESDLDAEVGILKTGYASFPLIESVKIGGLSVDEAAALILARYGKDYLRNPKLTLTVSTYATEFVSVIGQVTKPGQMPLPDIGQLDVGAALAAAGGITELADPKNIRIVSASGEQQVMTYQAAQGDTGRLKLKAGDQIIVAESPYARSKVAVIGEVKVPGNVSIPNTGKLDLASALATAGGPGEIADTSRIKVISSSGATNEYSIESIRNGSAGKRLLKGGDRVVVSPSRYANATVTLLGQVSRPGAIAFPINGKLDFMTAVAKSGGFTELASMKKITVTRGGNVSSLDVRGAQKEGRTIWLYPDDVVTVGEGLF